MQITRAGEYAVQGVTFLARKGLDEVVMIEEVCQAESIPRSFLAKIFQNLTRAGIVRSQRGVHGGFRLSRPASEITVLEILEAVEGKLVFDRRLQEPALCGEQNACSLCDIFTEVQFRAKEIFGNTTLADLTRPKDEVMQRIKTMGRSTKPIEKPSRPSRSRDIVSATQFK